MDEKNKDISKDKIKNNTKTYLNNKIRYIPKADIEMMREDNYEVSGIKTKKKYKYWYQVFDLVFIICDKINMKVISLNNELLSRLSKYLNDNPNAITINQVNKVIKAGVDEKYALKVLLDEYLEYRYDYTSILFKEDINKYLSNPYYKNISFNNKRKGNWQLKISEYKPYELFVSDNFFIKDEEVLPHIGYFNKPFKYQSVYQNNRLWMSITPNEINTMEKDINDAKGNILVVGLGLGYFQYMTSLKSDVLSIDVVEVDKDIIKLFKNQILPQFDNKYKVNIINDDVYNYFNNNDLSKYDYIYIDIWHDVSDGLTHYLKLKKFEEKYQNTIFRYWIYDSIKYYL